MEVTIGQFAKIVATTVRTLRYYDKIELLTPQKYNKSGRKLYTQLEWELYQQIMILKHFGLSLHEIKEQLTDQKLKHRELLLAQKQLIEKKQAELNDMLEVISRMERLYGVEGISEEELHDFTFILLDLFRREKIQMQAIEHHFKADEQLMKEIKLLHNPQFQEKLDREMLLLIQAISHAIQFDDAPSRQKVQDILKKMDHLFPANRSFLNLTEDDDFFAKYSHEFNNYFPEDIARYILKEMKAYYTDKENHNDNKE
ncbi:MerR family transcriptional regulator [Alkalicoccobacillus porphyridii]|uniref:MerR family transcriptional regulator n=1 Tax=Alkalicoccobacillus porphyridii TaxID=2597270 RepID=A0A554A2L3_9BACI|nr:MerR family transcriptional regulator [Alkalicoccobacillus porphyridii]TSB47939.1 MerR family transcriptional regulator [Alkalicoccobacillus porphyridii]